MKKILLIGFCCLATFVSFAQTGGPTPDPNAGGGGGGVPIDGGIGFLAAAGVAYGAKKLWEKKKEE